MPEPIELAVATPPPGLANVGAPASARTSVRGERPIVDAIDPASRTAIASVFATSAHELPALIARARKASSAWIDLSPAQRARALTPLYDLIVQQTPEIAATIARSMGKPLIEALSFDVAAVLRTLGDCIDRPRRNRGPARAVVCVIAPIGLPFERALSPAILALAAGSAVVVKPSSSAPLVGELIARLFAQALSEFPGLAQVAYGGAELGHLLATAEGVDFVVFSGSRANARKVQAALEPLQRPASFEPVAAVALIVCEDANLERAANAAVFGRFCNNGQGGATVGRVYVQRTLAAEFVHKVVHKVRALKSGSYADPHCELGPLASVRGFEQLRAIMQDAIDQRATMLTGGFPGHVTGHNHGERRSAQGQGFYWPPTVFTDVDRSTRLMREETFGPILAISAVEDEREAIALANETANGFGACLFSGERTRANRIATQLQVRVVAVNDLLLQAGAPGGCWSPEPDEAGDGHAAPARETQLLTPQVLIGNADADREPTWFPYSAAKLNAVEQAAARRAPRHDDRALAVQATDG